MQRRKISNRRLAFSLMELLAVVTILGIIAAIIGSIAVPRTADESNTRAILCATVRQQLMTTLGPGTTVLIVNRAAHKVADVKQAGDEAGPAAKLWADRTAALIDSSTLSPTR